MKHLEAAATFQVTALVKWNYLAKIIIFHQPGFPWNKEISLTIRCLLGAQVVWRRELIWPELCFWKAVIDIQKNPSDSNLGHSWYVVSHPKSRPKKRNDSFTEVWDIFQQILWFRPAGPRVLNLLGASQKSNCCYLIYLKIDICSQLVCCFHLSFAKKEKKPRT